MPGSTGEPRGHARLRLLPPPARRRSEADRTARHDSAAAKAPVTVLPTAAAHGAATAGSRPIPQRKPAPAAPAGTAQSITAAPLSHWVRAALFIGALLLARATLIQNLAPFHLALAAAALYLLPAHWHWTFAGAFLGRLIWAGPTMAFFDVLILGGIYTTARAMAAGSPTLAAALPTAGGPKGALLWRPVSGAAFAALVGTGLRVLLLEPTSLGILVLLFRTALIALVTTVFIRGLAPLHHLLGHRPLNLAQLIGDWSESERRSKVAPDEWLAAAVLMGSLIAALQGLQVGPISLAAAAGALVVLFFAAWGGPGLGAAAGAAAGLLVLLQAPGSGLPAAAYAVSGLLAGLFREFGLVGAAGGYAIGILLLAGFSLDPGVMVTELWSLLPAAGLYAGARFWLDRTGAKAVAADEVAAAGSPHQHDTVAPERRGAAPDHLQPIVLSPAAIAVVPPAATAQPTPAVVPTATACDQGTAPMGQLAHLMRDMAAALQVATPSAGQGPGLNCPGSGPAAAGMASRQMEQWLNRLAAQTCTGCIHYTTCWEQEFFITYQGLMATIVRREMTGHINETQLPAALRTRCPRKARLTASIDHAYDILLVHRHWSQKMQDLRGLMAGQLDSLAEVARYLQQHPPTGAASGQVSGHNGRSPANGPVINRGMKAAVAAPYRVGVARVARDERLVSGDSYLTRLLPGGRLALLLSDGMGAGMAAARESRTAVELLERLLGLDLEPSLAINLINRLLMARVPEDSYTTLDLALIDLATPSARFVKVGAPPSFLRQADRVGVIRAGTPPVGIVAEVAPEIAIRRLRYGDLIVMVTDGVLGAWQDVRAGEEWLKGFLGGLSRDQPRWVATQVIRQALRHAGGEVRDDMTALAVKIL